MSNGVWAKPWHVEDHNEIDPLESPTDYIRRKLWIGKVSLTYE